MLPSRCTALVLGAALSLGLPAALGAGESADPSASSRVPAPQQLGDHGIATYQIVRQDPAGGRLWWFFDTEAKPLGSLEYRPPAAAPAKDAAAGDTYVLSFKDEVLVVQTAPVRVVMQLNDAPPVAFVYDKQNHRVVADAANREGAFEAIRPRLKLLNTLIDVLMRKAGTPAAAPAARAPAAPEKGINAPELLDEEAPCTGDWHNRSSWGVFPTRSWACSDATIRLHDACGQASTGACGTCCELNPDCDCACVPETDFFCFCNRSGKACAPGCPPEQNPGAWCSPQHCSIDCVAKARAAVPSDHRIIGGACNFANECKCDAWINTCKPSDGSRHTFYSGVQECPDPCPPATPCGYGSCSGSAPQCCFEAFCAPAGNDCCSDGGSCPGGWNCCDDGTSSCCPGGSRCCWLDDGPMCCSGGGDTSPGEPAAPLYTTPRLQKNQPPASPQDQE